MSVAYGTAAYMASNNNNVTVDSNSYDRQVVGAAKYINRVYGPECAAKWQYQTHWSSGTTLWRNQLDQTIMLRPHPGNSNIADLDAHKFTINTA